jgi:hypothetical protein
MTRLHPVLALEEAWALDSRAEWTNLLRDGFGAMADVAEAGIDFNDALKEGMLRAPSDLAHVRPLRRVLCQRNTRVQLHRSVARQRDCHGGFDGQVRHLNREGRGETRNGSGQLSDPASCSGGVRACPVGPCL